jgi:hypothetical protein
MRREAIAVPFVKQQGEKGQFFFGKPICKRQIYGQKRH